MNQSWKEDHLEEFLQIIKQNKQNKTNWNRPTKWPNDQPTKRPKKQTTKETHKTNLKNKTKQFFVKHIKQQKNNAIKPNKTQTKTTKQKQRNKPTNIQNQVSAESDAFITRLGIQASPCWFHAKRTSPASQQVTLWWYSDIFYSVFMLFLFFSFWGFLIRGSW